MILKAKGLSGDRSIIDDYDCFVAF